MPIKKIERPTAQVTITLPTSPRYDVDDVKLIVSTFVLDQKLDITDLITLAQARYYLSARPDGKIPPVLRQQVQRIRDKYMKREVAHVVADVPA